MAMLHEASLAILAAIALAVPDWWKPVFVGLLVMIFIPYLLVNVSPVLMAWLLPEEAPQRKDAPQRIPREERIRVEKEQRDHANKGDHAAVVDQWQRLKKLEDGQRLDLEQVIDSMLRLGQSPSEIAAELKSGVECNPELVYGIAPLPPIILLNRWLEMLEALLDLLMDLGQPAILAIYEDYMGLLLERGSFEHVAVVASKAPQELPSARVNCMCATAAASRGLLDEALGHLRKMPKPTAGARSIFAAGVIAKILALAVCEQRMSTTVPELKRVNAKVEPREFDELVALGKSQRPEACQELLDAKGDLVK